MKLLEWCVFAERGRVGWCRLRCAGPDELCTPSLCVSVLPPPLRLLPNPNLTLNPYNTDPNPYLILRRLEDVRLMEAHSYGAEVNYRIAAPLLHDLRHSLEVIG